MGAFIVAWHPDYGSCGYINGLGRVQTRRLIEAVKPYLPYLESTASLFSSPATRAVEMAELIAKAYGLCVESSPLLWPEHSTLDDLTAMCNLMHQRAEQQDVVIVVTHLDYIESMAILLSTLRHLPYEEPLQLQRGQALVLESNATSWRRL